MPDLHILVADDQAHIRDSLGILLDAEGFRFSEASHPGEVLSVLADQDVDMVLMDMNYTKDTTSGEEGLDLVAQIRQQDMQVPIIVMTAWANIDLSVSAIKAGANDFIEKPWNNNRLLSLINNHVSLRREKQTNARLSELNRPEGAADNIVAQAESMQGVMRLIERTAVSDANILLTGESGVGKSLFAGFIHNLSLRREAPLVSVNMGALSDTLFESELFGHQKGAFTDAKANRMGRFELADTGTLFLDEIANIPSALQGKLLRVLESGEFEPLGSSKTKRADVRIVSASNANFHDEIDAGRFRQDLLYRLNTVTIEIPPLRRRIEDIEPMAQAFLQKYRGKYRRPDLVLSESAICELQQYSWPGNVRELSHCIERAVLMAAGDQIVPSDLGLNTPPSSEALADMTLEQAEKYLITQALYVNQGNVLLAAEKLGISRAALYRRMEKYEGLKDLVHKG